MYWMGEWELIAFEKAPAADKKYCAILKERISGRKASVPFGRPGYWHYKDVTGLGLYSKLDHHNDERRKRVRERFSGCVMPQMYSPQFFSFFYLW
jgi:hypothetical protein